MQVNTKTKHREDQIPRPNTSLKIAGMSAGKKDKKVVSADGKATSIGDDFAVVFKLLKEGGVSCATTVAGVICKLSLKTNELSTLLKNNNEMLEALKFLKNGQHNIEQCITHFNQYHWCNIDVEQLQLDDVTKLGNHLKGLVSANKATIQKIHLVNGFGCAVCALNVVLLAQNLQTCIKSGKEVNLIKTGLLRLAIGLDKMMLYIPKIKEGEEKKTFAVANKVGEARVKLTQFTMKLENLRAQNVRSGATSLLAGTATVVTTAILPFSTFVSAGMIAVGGANAASSLWNAKIVYDISKLTPMINKCLKLVVDCNVAATAESASQIPDFGF